MSLLGLTRSRVVIIIVEAAVGALATWVIGQVVSNSDVRDVGVVFIWLAVIVSVAVAWPSGETGAVKPFDLAFAGLDLQVMNPGSVRVAIVLQNFTEVPVEYLVESFVVSLDGRTAVDPKFDNYGSVVQPKQKQSYRYPVIDGIDLAKSPLVGKLEARFTYGRPSGKHAFRSFRQLRYSMFQMGPNTYGWDYSIESEREEAIRS